MLKYLFSPTENKFDRICFFFLGFLIAMDNLFLAAIVLVGGAIISGSLHDKYK